jgi:putative ABC transport system permease protein
MNLSDFRIGWRLLVKEPFYSVVTVLGLSIGFAACFLLLALARNSFSYDADIPQNDSIYMLKVRYNSVPEATWNSASPLVFRDVANRSGLPVTSSAFVKRTKSVRIDNHVLEVDMHFVDPAFRDIFSVKTVEGDLRAALQRPDALAVTLKTAKKLFGDVQVVGRLVSISGHPYQVMAVVADPSNTTTLPYTILAGINSSAWNEDERRNAMTAWATSYGSVYFKLGAGATEDALLKVLQDAADQSPYRTQIAPDMLQKLAGKKPIDVRLAALPNIYLDPDFDYMSGSPTHGNRNTVLGLIAVAFLILLLASINYVNLATVRTVSRQREIGMRKVLGAGMARLLLQFVTESVLVALLATLIGGAMAWALSGPFSELVNRNLDSLFSPASIASALALGLLVGMLAGAYPAWVALRVSTAQALAGRGDAEMASGTWLRRILTVVQFATAMTLTATTIAIAWQTSFATTLSPGFNAAGMLHIDIPTDLRSPEGRGLRDAIARLQGVTGVTSALDAVGRRQGYVQTTIRHRGNSFAWQIQGVTSDFFKTYDLRALAGRLFDEKLDPSGTATVCVLNASAARALGFADPKDAVGQILDVKYWDVPQKIVGIAPDIRFQSLHETVKPMIYLLTQETTVLTIKTDSVEVTERAIENLWPQYYPNDVLKMVRARDVFAQNYVDDLRLAKLLGISALIAILIASFGIYVLSAHSVQRRRREIVLRKLYGADGGAIAKLMVKEFMYLLGVSAVIGLSLAYLAIERYLSGFAERAPIGAWTILLALCVALTTAALSVLRHTVMSMRMKPAQVLRS